MRGLGPAATRPTRIYLTGGACSVLRGWRTVTNDIDLSMEPELDSVYQAIPKLKEELSLNVELSAPSHFVPELPGWKDRCVFLRQAGDAAFYEYDFYSQALSKLVRGHRTDLVDVQHMVQTGLVEPATLMALFRGVEQKFVRFPSIDAKSLRRKLEKWEREQERDRGRGR